MVDTSQSKVAVITVTFKVQPSDVEVALRIWAAIERNGHPQVGWYSCQPWYKPEMVGYRDTMPDRTSDEMAAGEKAGAIISRLNAHDQIAADSLRCYYGAFPGAGDFSKGERARIFHQMHGIGERDYYRIRREAKRMVEGAFLLA